MDGNPGFDDVGAVVGFDKGKDFIPLKSLKDAGSKMTLSSDWDVADLNPFVGVHNAVQRGAQSIDTKVRITLDLVKLCISILKQCLFQAAIEYYTINGAYAMRQEDITGSLTVGKKADLVIVDRDIFSPSQKGNIKRTRIIKTILGGEEIYRNNLLWNS